MKSIDSSRDCPRVRPVSGIEQVQGVTYDGEHVWFAAGDQLKAFDPETGRRALARCRRHAGTAFDGRHLFQIAENRIHKIDPDTGRVLATIPGAGQRRRFGPRVGRGDALGRALSRPEDPPDRSRYRRDSPHHRVQPLRHRRDLGRRRAWHGTWEGEESDVRRIDPQTGEVLERLEMPTGVGVSGLESTAATGSSAVAEQRQGASRPPAEARLHAAVPGPAWA